MREVDLDVIQSQLFTVLQREACQLLDLSFRKKLESEASKNLINYLKLLKELRDLESEALNNLSDEDLQKLIQKKSKKEEKT